MQSDKLAKDVQSVKAGVWLIIAIIAVVMLAGIMSAVSSRQRSNDFQKQIAAESDARIQKLKDQLAKENSR